MHVNVLKRNTRDIPVVPGAFLLLHKFCSPAPIPVEEVPSAASLGVRESVAGWSASTSTAWHWLAFFVGAVFICFGAAWAASNPPPVHPVDGEPIMQWLQLLPNPPSSLSSEVIRSCSKPPGPFEGAEIRGPDGTIYRWTTNFAEVPTVVYQQAGEWNAVHKSAFLAACLTHSNGGPVELLVSTYPKNDVYLSAAQPQPKDRGEINAFVLGLAIRPAALKGATSSPNGGRDAKAGSAAQQFEGKGHEGSDDLQFQRRSSDIIPHRPHSGDKLRELAV